MAIALQGMDAAAPQQQLGQRPAACRPPAPTLLLTVAPSLRRCTSVRSRIASAMAASGMTCGAARMALPSWYSAGMPAAGGHRRQALPSGAASARLHPAAAAGLCSAPGTQPRRQLRPQQRRLACPYSSLSSSCRRQRGSSAEGSCTICTISGRRVPISEDVMLKRNWRGGGGWGRGWRRRGGRQDCGTPNKLLPTSAQRASTPPMRSRRTGRQRAAMRAACAPGWVLRRAAARLTPRKASSSEDLPSDWPPMATISGMFSVCCGRVGPRGRGGG